MKATRLLVLLVLFVPFMVINTIHAETRLVPDEYSTIQAGIDACVDWDVVIVSPGTYTGEGNRDISFQGKAITVRSLNPKDPNGVADTVIDCQGTPSQWHRGIVFNSQEDANSTLAGLTITGGCHLEGAGVLIQDASPTIRQCVIQSNLCDTPLSKYRNSPKKGGGILVDEGQPHIIDCVISDNVCLGHSTRGGGIAYIRAKPFIKGCTITGNSARDAGGGIYCYSCPDVLIEKCEVRDNKVTFRSGGGIDFRGSDGDLINCLIVENESGYGGSGFHAETCDANVINCTIANNTSSSEHSGGLYSTLSQLDLRNTIIWGNTNENDTQIVVQSWSGSSSGRGGGNIIPVINSTLKIAFSDIQGGAENIDVYVDPDWFSLNWAHGNIESDPCFVGEAALDPIEEPIVDPVPDTGIPGRRLLGTIKLDGVNLDYHLKSQAGRWAPNQAVWTQDQETSPCIDAGDPNSSIGWETFPHGEVINMGAYGGTLEASRSVKPTKSWNERYQELLATMEPGIHGAIVRKERGFLHAISLEPEEYLVVEGSNGLPPDQIVLAFLEQWKDVFMVNSGAMEWSVTKVTPQSYGTIVRLAQTYAGIDIYHASAVVQIDLSGGVVYVVCDGMTDPGPLEASLNLLNPTLQADQAVDLAVEAMAENNPDIEWQASGIELKIFDGEVLSLSGPPRLVPK